MKRLLLFLREEDGPTTVEYAVMLALIVGVCLGAVMQMANATAASYNDTTEKLADVMGP